MTPASYHNTRFEYDARRETLWKTLCDAYFSKLIEPGFHVLDLGAGYAHFINNVRCAKRTAVDRWPLLPKYAGPGVEAHEKKLRAGGTLNILQPNYRRACREYFDDYTHIAVYSDISLCDFLQANGYRIVSNIPGFWPFSLKSRLPMMPWLIRSYLLPPWKPLAKQMLVRAVPA